jgi:hypothetical protein
MVWRLGLAVTIVYMMVIGLNSINLGYLWFKDGYSGLYAVQWNYVPVVYWAAMAYVHSAVYMPAAYLATLPALIAYHRAGQGRSAALPFKIYATCSGGIALLLVCSEVILVSAGPIRTGEYAWWIHTPADLWRVLISAALLLMPLIYLPFAAGVSRLGSLLRKRGRQKPLPEEGS